MPELDAEHRDQLALTLFDLGLDTSEDWWNRQADALAPLVAGWLADAWDTGRKVGRRDSEEVSEHSHPGLVGVTCHSHDGITHWHDNGGPAYTITHANPYRGGDS